MRIEYLGYLIDFSQTGSISATAHKNYMSEQGMNRIFRQIEKESNVVLLNKTGKTLSLTEAGEAIAEKARPVVDGYRKIQDICDIYSLRKQEAEERVYVFSTPCVSMCLLPLLDLQDPKRFPFPVLLREDNLDAIIEELSQNRIGNGIGLVTRANNKWASDILDRHSAEKGLCYQPLFRSKVVALVSASSPLAHKTHLPGMLMQDVSKESPHRERWEELSFGCPKDKALLITYEDIIREEKLKTVTSNMQILKQQVRRGQISMLVPELLLASMDAGKGIAELSLTDSDSSVRAVEFGMLVPSKSAINENARIVADYVMRYLREKVKTPRIGERYMLAENMDS